MISSIAGGNAVRLGEYYFNEQQQVLHLPKNNNLQQLTPMQSAYSQLDEFDPQSYFGSEYSRRYSDYIQDDQEIKLTVCDMEN